MINTLIDIGSNTIRLVIYEDKKEIFNTADYSGLISYVKDGKLSDEGLKKLTDVLIAMKKISAEYEAESLYAFATASLRDICDKETLIFEIANRTGITIDIISGQAEAMYDYIAIKDCFGTTSGAAFDLGGGSCQLMYFENGLLPECKSMPIGALRMYNTYVSGVLPTKSERREIERCVRKNLSDFGLLKGYGKVPLFAMGGAACTLYSITEKLTKKCKTVYTASDLESIAALDEEIIRLVAPKRLTTIVPAIITILEILKYIGTDEIQITEIGVRDGIVKNILK